MADDEHKHGNMDIRDHERTFEGFVRAVGYSAVVILIALVLLAMING